jgi:uncharacterized protein YutE (UPF0331/DUF86 family)
MTKGQADAAIIRRHLAALREALVNLQRHKGHAAHELRASADLRWTVERGLQLCVQNVLDVASHLVAARGLDAPDYATAIDKLAEIGVLPAEFAVGLRPLAGFRNVLVHGYLQVDLAIVERVLNEKLLDLEQFATDVEAYLARLDKSAP